MKNFKLALSSAIKQERWLNEGGETGAGKATQNPGRDIKPSALVTFKTEPM
jgi:hypothetical protein